MTILPRVDIVAAHWAWFGGGLFVSTAVSTLVSPKRRALLGTLKYIAAWITVAAPPLFGAVCVRGGYALAHRETGMNGFLAQLAGAFWAMIFILVARTALLLFPPTAGLLREWRRANREASVFRDLLRSRPRAD